MLLNDAAVADFFDRQVERGLEPSKFARVWLHTHLGDSAMPSWTDQETFGRVFGGCGLGRDGHPRAGRQDVRPTAPHRRAGAEVRLPVRVDWDAPFRQSDHDGWLAEHAARVEEEPEWESFHDGLMALDELAAGSLWAAAPD